MDFPRGRKQTWTGLLCSSKSESDTPLTTLQVQILSKALTFDGHLPIERDYRCNSWPRMPGRLPIPGPRASALAAQMGWTNSGPGDGVKMINWWDKHIHKLTKDTYKNHDVQCFFLIFISFLQPLYLLTPKLNDEVILNLMRVHWHPNSKIFHVYIMYMLYWFIPQVKQIKQHTEHLSDWSSVQAFAWEHWAWQNINIHQIGSGFFAKRQEDVWASDGRGVSV